MDDREHHGPLMRLIRQDELLMLSSAVSWLFGFVEGAGRDIPPHVAEQAAKLIEWSHPHG